MKRFFIVLALAVGLVVVVVLGRTLAFRSKQLAPLPSEPLVVDQARAVEHLQQAVRVETISHQDPSEGHPERFKELHAVIEQAFPKVHASLKREIVNESALLYTWQGTQPDEKPILLLAHMDVVPAENAGEWTQPPFSGAVVDGFIWGRGTLDDKGSVMGILEAVEALLETGFAPRRTVYLAFGCDEEISGDQGAGHIAALLKERGVRAEFSLDEGMAIVEGIVPGVEKPLALIGVAEKGYLTLELVVEGEGGHSSQPPPETTLGILSRAVVQVESHPFPAQLGGAARQMFDYIGPEMPFPMRAVFANLWLFQPLVKHELEASDSTNASLRTTTAVTMMQGGTKENSLASRARAIVNFRILPGDTIVKVVEHVQDVIADGRVQVRVLEPANEPSPVSSVEAPVFETLHRTIRGLFPEVIVSPTLDLGATDSRHYEDVAENLYRFGPLWLNSNDLARIHGTDERISVKNYVESVQFFGQFIRNTAG